MQDVVLRKLQKCLFLRGFQPWVSWLWNVFRSACLLCSLANESLVYQYKCFGTLTFSQKTFSLLYFNFLWCLNKTFTKYFYKIFTKYTYTYFNLNTTLLCVVYLNITTVVFKFFFNMFSSEKITMATFKVFSTCRGITSTNCAVHSVVKSLRPLLSHKAEWTV